MSRDPLQEQQDYYRARAGEYDQWWLRQGRYDRGPECNAQWHAEAGEVAAALAAFQPSGQVLELACGTGIWTEHLARTAEHVTAVDGSAEMLALNAARVASAKVRYVEADLFAWQPEERFEVIFFAFWLSHVPPEKLAAFWEKVARGLAPGGRVFLVDSRREPTSTAVDHQLPEPSANILTRRLDDGRAFQVYKIFHDPAVLTAQLRSLGWRADLRQTAHYFLYGSLTRLG